MSSVPGKAHNFLDGLVTFTHFIQVHYKPNKDTLKRFLHRSAAVALKQNNPGADCCIPVLFPDNSIGVILVQVCENLCLLSSLKVKNWSTESSGSAKVLHGQKEHLSATATLGDGFQGVPTLSIWMQLGGYDSQVKIPTSCVQKPDEYQIVINGLGKIMPFLDTQTKNQITTILEANQITPLDLPKTIPKKLLLDGKFDFGKIPQFSEFLRFSAFFFDGGKTVSQKHSFFDKTNVNTNQQWLHLLLPSTETNLLKLQYVFFFYLRHLRKLTFCLNGLLTVPN